MSGAGIFFLILLILLLVYFFGGFIILAYRGATGCELIPNYYFWKGLLSNMKKGLCFVWHGCRPTDSYEQI